MSNKLSPEESKKTFAQIKTDLIRPLNNHKGMTLWVSILAGILMLAVYAYYIQVRDGLGVTGMRDFISWGLYIGNFVFFVATALVGMLVSAVLGLAGAKWITPLGRIAEIIAFSFAAWAGLVIVIDMGRPDRLLNVFLHGRVQSPIVWDLTVVTTYVTISALLLLLPMIPDMPHVRKRMEKAAGWQKKIYELLSFSWAGTKEQVAIIHKATKTLLILIVPVAFAIHTVTSWLFASTLRAGWDSTIFGPYFVAGAFPAGVGAMLIAMYVYRRSYKLKDYITEMHFDKMGKVLVLLSLVYLYFNINEFLVPAYKMKTADAHHIHTLFAGKHAIMFWSVQIFGLILPIIALLFKKGRKPLPSLFIGILVVVGAFLKRFLIVVPTMEHAFLPMQNVPENFLNYSPTAIEIILTMAPIAGALLVITILSKLFPIIPIWETAIEKGVRDEDLNDFDS